MTRENLHNFIVRNNIRSYQQLSEERILVRDYFISQLLFHKSRQNYFAVKAVIWLVGILTYQKPHVWKQVKTPQQRTIDQFEKVTGAITFTVDYKSLSANDTETQVYLSSVPMPGYRRILSRKAYQKRKEESHSKAIGKRTAEG